MDTYASHTHEDGLYIMNPGSCHGYDASYGDYRHHLGEIVTNTVSLKSVEIAKIK